MVPLYVRFGDESKRDYVEMGPEEFYARLRTATELPTTSQPTPGDFLAAYEELGAYERDLLAAHLREALRHVRQRAARPRRELGDKVRVVDTETASAGDRDARRSRSSAASTAARPTRRSTSSSTRFKRDAGLIFTVDTLEFLQKGGRIGKAAAFAGNLLNIKPILSIDGRRGRCRSSACAGTRRPCRSSRACSPRATHDTPSLRVGIAHADAPEREQTLRALVSDLRPQAQIDVATTLGAVVGTHAGPAPSGSSGSTTPSEAFCRLRVRACPGRGVRRRGGGFARRRGAPTQHFVSRPDLRPPTVHIVKREPGTARGYIFIAPKKKVDDQAGPMIVNDLGERRLVPSARHARRVHGLPRAARSRQARHA